MLFDFYLILSSVSSISPSLSPFLHLSILPALCLICAPCILTGLDPSSYGRCDMACSAPLWLPGVSSDQGGGTGLWKLAGNEFFGFFLSLASCRGAEVAWGASLGLVWGGLAFHQFDMPHEYGEYSQMSRRYGPLEVDVHLVMNLNFILANRETPTHQSSLT